MSPHPPRPRLVVRVGITGHRWNKLKRQDADQIRRRVTEGLQTVGEIARRIGNETGSFENSAERSRRTRRTLEELRKRGIELPLDSVALGDLATEAAQAMDEELGSWFSAYRGKGVTYP